MHEGLEFPQKSDVGLRGGQSIEVFQKRGGSAHKKVMLIAEAGACESGPLTGLGILEYQLGVWLWPAALLFLALLAAFAYLLLI